MRRHVYGAFRLREFRREDTSGGWRALDERPGGVYPASLTRDGLPTQQAYVHHGFQDAISTHVPTSRIVHVIFLPWQRNG